MGENMLIDKFFDMCIECVDSVRLHQVGNIKRASAIICEAIMADRGFYVFDHEYLLSSELVSRAGGAAFVRSFKYTVPSTLFNGMGGMRKRSIEKINQKQRIKFDLDFEETIIERTFYENGISKGDVILINSSSGEEYPATIVAKVAQRKGTRIIVITPIITKNCLISSKKSKKLYDYAEVLINNHFPLCDSIIDRFRVNQKEIPMGGITSVCIGWALIAETIELLVANGIKPTIYRSVNIEGGEEQNLEAIHRYDTLGY